MNDIKIHFTYRDHKNYQPQFGNLDGFSEFLHTNSFFALVSFSTTKFPDISRIERTTF